MPRYADSGVRCALYRHFNANGDLLYVGQSVTPFQRNSTHDKGPWADEIARVTIEWLPDLGAARAAETLAIARENPRYNIARPTPPGEVRQRKPARPVRPAPRKPRQRRVRSVGPSALRTWTPVTMPFIPGPPAVGRRLAREMWTTWTLGNYCPLSGKSFFHCERAVSGESAST